MFYILNELNKRTPLFIHIRFAKTESEAQQRKNEDKPKKYYTNKNDNDEERRRKIEQCDVFHGSKLL